MKTKYISYACVGDGCGLLADRPVLVAFNYLRIHRDHVISLMIMLVVDSSF